jgi:hypothetical protein
MELGLGHINLTDEEILAGNPALVSFLDILEDDDKFAKWEREKVPGLVSYFLLLTVCQTTISFTYQLFIPAS